MFLIVSLQKLCTSSVTRISQTCPDDAMCIDIGNPCINDNLVCFLTVVKYVPNGYVSTFSDQTGRVEVHTYRNGGAYCSSSELNWLGWVIVSVCIVVVIIIVLIILCCCGCMACCCAGCAACQKCGKNRRYDPLLDDQVVLRSNAFNNGNNYNNQANVNRNPQNQAANDLLF